MTRKPSKTIEEKIYEAKLKVIEIDEEYRTQLYFETMPTTNPSYQYCYATSNFTIPAEQQSVDAWLRAVIKHMAMRRPGHGGEVTKALLISIPEDLKEIGMDAWIDYETRKLRKRATSRVKKAK
ncbi:hypothetical protein FD975_06570 [Polynucleobacter sp. AP-Jannik-300A-C4]|uniref:hypothetical protein n=1 Tax=Polynucleobacter sp. AP-Jannik-300A-C4 TaxID=2576928 RepID=UPI001BFD0236|nr:hypothetical protein [Polynucleobacter sp. AP-Jannik-300A-C4]QWE21942.1 hypothetical protein FD975_06570 [Polynucleobacter sp. AP-Jannik-300A-C4]